MDFGITFPSYIEAWKDAQIAEDNGFSHAWFYDSQLLYSDVYATMALVAEHTTRMRLGTLVAIPSNRLAPVTASAIATINYLAPGRVVLGVGTGFTGRNTMGLPALSARAMQEYIEQVRALLRGEDALFREGEAERWIRLLHPEREHGFVNVEDPIPIYVAANGPRAVGGGSGVGGRVDHDGAGTGAPRGELRGARRRRPRGRARRRQALHGAAGDGLRAPAGGGAHVAARDRPDRVGGDAGPPRRLGGGVRTRRQPRPARPRDGGRLQGLHRSPGGGGGVTARPSLPRRTPRAPRLPEAGARSAS